MLRPQADPPRRPARRRFTPSWAARESHHRVLDVTDWKRGADFAKTRPWLLAVADRLGREVGRARILDRLASPRPTRRPDLSQWDAAGLGACWIGHATLLLRVGGRTVLTDPVFSPRVGVGLVLGTLGPVRRQAPALDVPRLPHVDLILLSHAHFDHLDRPSLWRLARRDRSVPVICAAGTADLVRDLGFRRVAELDWSDATDAGGLRVTALPVEHWGPRVFFDGGRGYCGFLIEHRDCRVVFGGDTAYTPAFAKVAPVDLMCVGIGAYDPYIAAHADPEQAWRMTRQAGAKVVVPMHHSTFKLSYEPPAEPLTRFLAAAGSERGRVKIRRVGDVWTRPLSTTAGRPAR